MPNQLRVALVHDYLNEFGGAERVLLALSEIYPDAPIYTAFFREESQAYRRFKGKKIITSWAQNVPFFASKLHSPLRFLAPLVWNSFDFSDFDLVIGSSNWYVTKGFKKSDKGDKRAGRAGGFIEICYCHTPPRYLYGYPTATSQKHPLVKVYALLVNHFMRVYDYEAAQKVDWFIANSKEVAGRIKKFYRGESTVIYPPVDTERFARLKTKDQGLTHEKKALDVSRLSLDGYFLVVSRLVGAKNVDVAVEVCTKLRLPLKVVGEGRDRSRLEGIAGKNVEFLGDVDDKELVKLYQNCRALIFPASMEDFGIVPVEAMAAGKPVIALAEGGVLETVVDGKTGILVRELSIKAFEEAVKKFVEMEKKGEWDPSFIQNHAQKFSKERFKREVKDFVASKVG